MSEATPRPWKHEPSSLTIVRGLITPEDVDAFHIQGPTGQSIAYSHRGDEECAANADLIVRAVNAHDALVLVCEGAIRDAEARLYMLPIDGEGVSQQKDILSFQIGALHSVLALAKEAVSA